MSEREPVADQIRHYRALAQIAADCALGNSSHTTEYSRLSRHWFELVERLERDAGMRGIPRAG